MDQGRDEGPAQAHVELDICLGVDPIRGLIRDAAGCESPFSGWLELIAALELASAAQERGDLDHLG